jgi:hypothetical protein
VEYYDSRVAVTGRFASVKLEFDASTLLVKVETKRAYVTRLSDNKGPNILDRPFKNEEAIIFILSLTPEDEDFAALIWSHLRQQPAQLKDLCERMSSMNARRVAILEFRLIMEGSSENLSTWGSGSVMGLGLEQVDLHKSRRNLRLSFEDYVFEYDIRKRSFENLGLKSPIIYPIRNNYKMKYRNVVLMPRWDTLKRLELLEAIARGFGEVTEEVFLSVISHLLHADEYVVLLFP